MTEETSTENRRAAVTARATPWERVRSWANRYAAAEIAGAFGDLGILIPFVVGYLTVLQLDPTGVLLGFGLSLVLSGLYYRTPVPVQPMKAIGATAIAGGSGAVTGGMMCAAALVTGGIWLVMGLTGAIRWVSALAARPVVSGIVLGLGLSFVVTGVEEIAAQPIVGGAALVLTFLLLSCRIPVMFLLLVFGICMGLLLEPTLLGDLSRTPPSFSPPSLGFSQIAWDDFVPATLLLVLPQLPLTVGNAVIAVTAEHNRIFPDRAVGERMISVTTGIMNSLAALVGGVPMCHGAGGLAAHVRFGARTGGAGVILGVVLIALGLFFHDGVAVLFALFPRGVLGVLVCFAGLELASSVRDLGTKEEAYTTLLVAGFAFFHMGLAFLAGLLLHHGIRRRWVRP